MDTDTPELDQLDQLAAELDTPELDVGLVAAFAQLDALASLDTLRLNLAEHAAIQRALARVASSWGTTADQLRELARELPTG